MSIYKLVKPLSKFKLTKFYMNQVLRTAISWQDLKPLAPNEADLKEEAAQNFLGNRQFSRETPGTSSTCF